MMLLMWVSTVRVVSQSRWAIARLAALAAAVLLTRDADWDPAIRRGL
jgi:hypothetical protein